MYLYLIFWGLYILTFLYTCLPKRKYLSVHSQLIWYWGFVTLFIILSTFRWENGTDWSSYLYYFNYVSFFGEGEMEIGYTILNRLTSSIGNYTFHLFIMSILCILPVAKYYVLNSRIPLFSLLVWFVCSLGTIFPVRQSISIALFAISLKYVCERKVLQFLLCILLASSFHVSALITLPVYWLWSLSFSRKSICVYLISFTVLVFLFKDLPYSFLSSFGGEYIQFKLNSYLDSADDNFGSAYSLEQIMFNGIVNRSFLLIFFFYYLDRKRKVDLQLNGYLNLYIYSFLLFLFLSPLSVALPRLCVYTDITQILLIPYVFKLKMRKNFKMLLFFVFSVYLFYRFNGVVNNYYDLYIPYHFVF